MLERRTVVKSGFCNSEVDKRDGWRADVMAIKTDRLSTAFTFFTLLQLYGVMEVLGLLDQLPWARQNCYEMAVTLGERCLCVCGPGKYGRTFVSCKALKVCNVAYTHAYTIHSITHTWQKHFTLMCSDKVRIVTVRMCQCVGVNVRWTRIRSERWASTWVWPYNSPLYTGTSDLRSAYVRVQDVTAVHFLRGLSNHSRSIITFIWVQHKYCMSKLIINCLII